MGLTVVVGHLADLMRHDPEAAADAAAQFDAINAVLATAGIAPHVEPQDVAPWDAAGYGYSGLHALREVAGREWQGEPLLPSPRLTGLDKPHADALFKASLPALTPAPRPGFWARLLGAPAAPDLPPFLHLVCHGDAAGHYLPVDFPFPLMPQTAELPHPHIWPVGSVPRLEAELDALIAVLGIPEDAQWDTPDLQAALGADPEAESLPLWLAQAIASYTALVLREACRRSRQTGAAIVFA